MSEILSAPYYWGMMDRYEAERLLDGKPEGTFLLRDSAQNDYLFSVSFRRYGRSLHARIEQLDHRFSFDSYDPNAFNASSVIGELNAVACERRSSLFGLALTEHYKDPSKCLFFEPQLSSPLKRNFTFSLQNLCRAAIVDSLGRYGDVQKLQLPHALKEYLEEYHYKQAVRVRKMENACSSARQTLV